MILKTTDAREPGLRQWLAMIAGEEAEFIEGWLWDQHGRSNFVEGLIAVAQEVQAHGPEWLREFVEFARKPKEVTELERQVIVWYQSRADKAMTTIMGHRGAKGVIEKEFMEIASDLHMRLRMLFPSRSSAEIKSALMQVFTHDEATFRFNASLLVKTLRSSEPTGVYMGSADRL